jgi:N-methylhydantoinase A
VAQVWELDTPLPCERFRSAADVETLVEAFHQVHERVFAVRDEGSQVECINWKGRLTVTLPSPIAAPETVSEHVPEAPDRVRLAHFGDGQKVETPIYFGPDLARGSTVAGPAIIEEPTTTVVVYPGMSARLSGAGNYILEIS